MALAGGLGGWGGPLYGGAGVGMVRRRQGVVVGRIIYFWKPLITDQGGSSGGLRCSQLGPLNERGGLEGLPCRGSRDPYPSLKSIWLRRLSRAVLG